MARWKKKDWPTPQVNTSVSGRRGERKSESYILSTELSVVNPYGLADEDEEVIWCGEMQLHTIWAG